MISPRSIKDYLDKYIIGQEQVKIDVANQMYLHVVKSNYNVQHADPQTNKLPNDKKFTNTNLMVIGPSGCGKTYVLEKAAEYVGLPFFKINARALSKMGYVGISFEDYITNFYNECENKLLFNYAIILLDEFDKLIDDRSATSERRSNFDLSLQYSLLKYLEGHVIQQKSYGMYGTQVHEIDTSLMMFVLAGNFQAIRDKRDDVRITPGFIRDSKPTEINYIKELTNYGVVKELMGRVANVIEVVPLTEDDYYHILKNSENSIYKQYQRIYNYIKKKEIYIGDKKLKEFAKKCAELDIGARGLNKVIFDYMSKTLYNMDEVENTEDLLKTEYYKVFERKITHVKVTEEKDGGDK